LVAGCVRGVVSLRSEEGGHSSAAARAAELVQSVRAHGDEDTIIMCLMMSQTHICDCVWRVIILCVPSDERGGRSWVRGGKDEPLMRGEGVRG